MFQSLIKFGYTAVKCLCGQLTENETQCQQMALHVQVVVAKTQRQQLWVYSGRILKPKHECLHKAFCCPAFCSMFFAYNKGIQWSWLSPFSKYLKTLLMSWSKRCLAWKDETSLPVANGLYYNPLTRTREPRRKPHNKYDRMHVREHIPVKPAIIFHGCYGAHSPWDHPRFSGMSSCNSVGSFSSQISTYELIEGRMYWDSLTSFWSCSYGIFQKTLNFILSELMIIFSLCPPPAIHIEKNQHETERRNISPARRPHSTLTRSERMHAGCSFKVSGSWIPHVFHQEAKLFGFYLDVIIKWWKAIIVPIKGGIFSTLFTAN